MDETISASVWNGGEVTETKQDIIISANVKQEPAEESEGDVGHAVPYGELEITYEPDIKTHRETVSGASNSLPIASSSLKRDKSVVASKWIQKDINTGWRRRVACNICKKTFAKLWDLKVHERIHTGEKPFECNICMKTFSQAGNLKKHRRIHTVEKPFECNICKKIFRYETRLNRHKRMHTSEKPSIFKFIQLIRRTGNSSMKREPAEESEGDVGHAIPYEDIDIHEPDIKEECERAKKETDLTSAASSPSKCDQTVVISKGIQEEKHVAKRKRKYCCNICMKTFSKLYNLKAHIRVHTGERPFVCNICMKRFGCKSYLNRHKRIHLRENPCDDQASITTEEVRMNVNVNIEPAEEEGEGDVGHAAPYGDIDIHDPDIKKECEGASKETELAASSSPDCDQRVVFSKRFQEKEHVDELKPRYTRNIKKRALTYVSILNRPEQIHTGEKPFESSICMKTFSWVSDLNKDERMHTSKKHFECNICMKTFDRVFYLNRHRRIHHRENELRMNVTVKQEPAEESEGDVGHAIPYGDIDIHEPGIKLECERVSGESNFIPVASSSCDQNNVLSKGIQVKEHVDKPKRKHCCSICTKTFIRVFNLNKHRRIHHRENPCDDHVRITNEDLRMNANVKQVPAEESEGDVGHAIPYGDIDIHEPGIKLECEKVSKDMSSVASSSSIFNSNHPLFPEKTKHNEHLVEQRETCKICSKTFWGSTSLSALILHKQIHPDRKPFECNICKKTFSRAGYLNSHKRSHTGDKPFECNICTKTFSRAGDLNSHKRIHSGDKPFECYICKKKFAHKCSLKLHKRIHVRGKT